MEALISPSRPFVARLDFAAVYDANVDRVWRVISRLGVRANELEDAVQDTFTIAFRSSDEFRGASKVSTWLIGIAVRVAHDYRRRSARKPTEPLEVSITRMRDSRPGPHELLELTRAAELLPRLLDQLEPTQRDAFVLIDLEHHTAVEVAELTSVPVNTVYSRLRLARTRFNQLVEALNRSPS